MKLRNWLPTKYLTEENPVIGLSFEVGFRRLLVMVGETIIFSMSNMIRGDVDSEIFNCLPGYMLLAQLPYGGMSGGFNRVGMGRVRSAHTPASRSHFAHKGEVLDYSEEALKKDVGGLQFTGRENYSEYGLIANDVQDLYRDSVALRRLQKLRDDPYLYGEMSHPRQLTNPEIYRLSGSMPNVGTVGHIDYGRVPKYLTKAMFEKQMRDGTREVVIGEEAQWTVRKLLNNGVNGIKPTGHSSLTAMCLSAAKPKSNAWPRIRAAYGDLDNYLKNTVFRRVEANLAEKYYFTGEGMLPKDL